MMAIRDGAMPMRTNHHRVIIEQIRDYLLDFQRTIVVVELHTTSMKRMPAQLKGVPDLIITDEFGTVYCEIKPIYTKSRDRLNIDQCRFAYDLYDIVAEAEGAVRYCVVKDFPEFRDFARGWLEDWYMDDWHKSVFERWCRTSGKEIPWE